MAIDISFLRQLDRFDVVLKRRVLSNYSGSRQSRNMGSGLVFYDYKDYVPGDDFRAIDWKVYGKTEEFFVRRYEDERNMRIHVVIDCSASMDFGTRFKKFEYASMIALGFCYMAFRNNERFEVSTFADDLDILRAKKGSSQLMSVFDSLSKMKPKGMSKFYDSVVKYKTAIKSKSMVIIISDFLFDPAQLRETLFHYDKSEVTIVQVLDSSERELDIEGDVVLTDSETHDRMRTFVSNRVIENYSEELLNHIYDLKRVCDDANAHFISVSTETPVFDTFYNLLGGKSDKVIL